MTLFVSLALFRRDGRMTYRPPRKEASGTDTQARKSASRFWSSVIQEPDKLTKIVVVNRAGDLIQVAEHDGGRRWVSYTASPDVAAKQPHIAACMAELGIDPASAPPAMPDVLEINGIVYRREI